VSDFVYRRGGNILHAEQHVDREAGQFFQRVEFELEGFSLGREEIAGAMASVFDRFHMRHQLAFSDERPRTAILVSRQIHCLQDLVNRWELGELRCELTVVIGNHQGFQTAVDHLGIESHVLPVTRETKADQEAVILTMLHERGIELVVLARYMQVLSPTFVDRFPNRIINIHHSFLPAFVGGKPYHQASERGVKLIGATAHYATEDLDEGPIIEQDVARVTHRDTVEDLVRRGRDLERVVLARAVRAHLEHRVLVYGRKTVVFD
jgi:formyltetrahydrofolate deformylase